MAEVWAPGLFLIARPPSRSAEVAGYIYRGVGLHILQNASPKGRRPTRWALTHLGSGHMIAELRGRVATVFPVATKIAECADWNFDGLFGWKNVDPDLSKKVTDIIVQHGEVASRPDRHLKASEEIARQIAASRW